VEVVLGSSGALWRCSSPWEELLALGCKSWNSPPWWWSSITEGSGGEEEEAGSDEEVVGRGLRPPLGGTGGAWGSVSVPPARSEKPSVSLWFRPLK